ncbi:four helix bundle protein [Longibacter salinarum]|uniref:Four helix bundle protein n=2 Tax=Longibacter salinarum TaxID=1850348 RepID=A0A2A8CTT2_9BACT|nr:four helix bundle protein [Longibacter salinarum]PEN11278.1 four helix bundle protein [Longibacter salinarum]
MQDLQFRTRKFAVDVFRFCDNLPRTPAYRIVSRQLMRSASSVGANYRAACHARSRAEFISKLGIAEEESDESKYWLEILRDIDANERQSEIEHLYQEADELTRIIITSIRTAKKNR